MVQNFKKQIPEIFLTLPTLAWLIIFFAIPTIVVLLMAFRVSDPYGGIGAEWTLQSIRDLGNPNYPLIIWRTIWLSILTTVICLILSIPSGYYLARIDKRWRGILLLLIIVPFWTNFLIRIFAWKAILHPEGIIKKALVMLNLISPDSLLLYRPGTVLIVLVYSYLPFALLPIYAASEKFDFSLIEAAYDLGASSFKAFTRIFLPGIRQGIITAIMVVFIPALGSYVIPDIVGGPDGEMIGNKIAQKTFIDRNLPHASALSVVLILVVLVPVIIRMISPRNRDKKLIQRGGQL